MIEVEYKNGKVNKFYFDEISKVLDEMGYFLVFHIVGVSLFDKRRVKRVELK